MSYVLNKGYFNMPNGLIAGIKEYKIGTKKDGISISTDIRLSFLSILNVKQIYDSCGETSYSSYASSLLDCSDSFKGCGSNSDGELGLGEHIKYSNDIVNIPIDYNSVLKVFRTKSYSNISSDFYGTIFIMKDGTVKGCGTNLYGYEGTTQYSIVDITEVNVKDVYYTNGQWYFIYNYNIIKGKGNNQNGKLGVGSNENYVNELTIIDIPTDGIINIINYSNTTLFLYDTGIILFSGSNLDIYNSSKNISYLIYNTKPLSYIINTPIKSTVDNIKKIGISVISQRCIMMLSNDKQIIYSNNVKDSSILCKENNITDFLSFSPTSYLGSKSGGNLRINYYLHEDGVVSVQDSYYKDLSLYLGRDIKNIQPWSYSNNNRNEFKIELWKNREEFIGDINKVWIDKITYKYNTEISDFQLNIPQFIGGQNKLNPIYDIIRSNQQIIITRIDGIKEVYILKEQIVYNEIVKGSKTFTVYSLQKKLEDMHIQISENNYNLYSNDSYETDNFVLNEVETQSKWTIGYVDENAKKELLTVKETKTIDNSLNYRHMYGYNSVVAIKDKDLLWEKYFDSNFDTVNNSIGKEPMYISFTYDNIRTYSSVVIDNNSIWSKGGLTYYKSGNYYIYNGDVIDFGTIYHEFDEPFYDRISDVKVYYCDEVGNRNSIKYVFTLIDDITKTIIKPFANITGKWLSRDPSTSGIKNPSLTYTTGNYIKENTLLKPWFETTDDTVAKVLSDISEVFNVAFEFDTINKFIHVYSMGSLGSVTNEASSQLGQFILGTSKLGSNPYTKTDSANLMLSYNDIKSVNKTDNDSEIISGLKVIGKDNLSIVNINPNGTDIIENWNYFINNGNLTSSCIASLTLYNSTLKTRQTNWNTMSQSYLDMNSTLITYESKVKSYQEQIIGLQSILSAYKSVNDTINIARIQTELTNSQTILNTTTIAKTTLEDDLKELSKTMATYSDGSRKENIVDGSGNKIFSWSDLQILNDLINIQTVNDDYFSDELALYEHYSQSMLEKVKPKVQFTTKTGNMSKYVYLNSNIIKLGLWYELDEELQKVFNESRIRLISFEYYPNKGSIGSFENLIYSNKVTSINRFRKSANFTSKVEKTSQTVSKITSSTNKISGTLTDKVGTTSLIDYRTDMSSELNNMSSELNNMSSDISEVSTSLSTKLSSSEFDTRFNKRQSDFDFTIGDFSKTKTAINKDTIICSGGTFKLRNTKSELVVNSDYNMPKILDKGYEVEATLEIGDTSKKIEIDLTNITINNKDVFDFSVFIRGKSNILDNENISNEAKLPYYRINSNYASDETIMFDLIVQVIHGGFNLEYPNKLIIKFTRPENYKDKKEIFLLRWIVYGE